MDKLEFESERRTFLILHKIDRYVNSLFIFIFNIAVTFCCYLRNSSTPLLISVHLMGVCELSTQPCNTFVACYFWQLAPEHVQFVNNLDDRVMRRRCCTRLGQRPATCRRQSSGRRCARSTRTSRCGHWAIGIAASTSRESFPVSTIDCTCTSISMTMVYSYKCANARSLCGA